ncbi:MAG: B12-binding domain-containing radical SAM protein [Chloroflexota bacterium]
MGDANTSVDFLFVHVPKRSNYYKPLDDFMFINYIPMGLFALCDLLNKRGISSRIKHAGLETILDENFSMAQWVKDRRVRIVGLSLQWHFQAFDVIDLAQKIKKASPETAILLGGFTASRFTREIMESFPEIDAIIAGDAEGGLPAFAQTVLQQTNDFTHVANCTWRSGGEIIENGVTFSAQPADLEGLDFANLSLLDHYEQYRDFFRLPMHWMNNADLEANMKRKLGAARLFPLAVGRGCAVNCTFCGGSRDAHWRLFHREQPFFRPVESVVDSMQAALSYGYNGFLVSFDPTPGDDSYYLELMAEVRRRGLRCGINYEAWGLPGRDFIDAFAQTFDLKSSYIALSPESGVEEIRRKNKGAFYSNQQLVETLEYLQTRQVPAMIYLTMGLPGETITHIQQTNVFARHLRKRFNDILAGIICLPIQIEPTSAIFEDPSCYGVRSNRASFMDFYRAHSDSHSGPYVYPGFALDSINPDEKAFAEILLEERCNNYCFLSPTLFGRFHANFIGKFLCNRLHAGWQRQGHGKPAAERKTFV